MKQPHLDKRGMPMLTLLLLAILALVVLISLLSGRYSVPLEELTGLFSGHALSDMTATVLLKVRIPRIAAAIIIGGALSASGAAYQGIFRNPMVSPDLLGASAGASFGAVLSIMLGLSPFFVQLSAFLFGAAAVALSFFISAAVGRGGGSSQMLLLLTGMVVSALFAAFVSFVKYIADPYDTLPAVTFWLMGGLTYITSNDVLMMLFPVALGLVTLFLLRWRLNILSFGDEEAGTLGINVAAVRLIVIVSATLLTSASVAVGGMIGWVGLIVPHLARMMVGPDYRRLQPISFLAGGIFLLAVDNISRATFTQELPLGILTAIIGAVFFIALLFKGRRGFI